METGLHNRIAIVAASSQGIGRATAYALAAEGCKVAICARNEQALAEVAADITAKHGVECMYKAVDVTQPEAVAAFVADVAARFGRIDICVTNAGGPPSKNFLEIKPTDWRAAFELNLHSTITFAREVIPIMRKNRWGRIIALTSVSVKQPIGDLVISNTIRIGVTGLVRSLSNEFAKDGILVNNVAPGYTATERLDKITDALSQSMNIPREELVKHWTADTATGKLARPEDIADAIVFLASDRAASITGQTILVDNGSYRGL